MQQPSFTTDWFSHNIPTWEQVISPHLRSLPSPKVLEVGAFEGRSSVWLLQNFPALRLTVIDPWAFTNDASEDTFKRFKNNVAPYSERVSVMKGKSQLMRSLPDREFDLVYIDGEHTSAAVIHDAVLGFELLKVGGLMIFDDYQGGDKTVMYPKPAVDFFHQAYGALNRLELISDSYQRIYRKTDGIAPPQY
ncbi:Methyltransferase domain-containing protein [Noviherbaspirillum humi]|uniref:Methyltransferase domain-containing protein n=1 Tax=Noviherbaspirillum humi TaxID=1688639 RepID=A0A239K752_9BURK|nr:class I SAM-dependent methyltransferase [Noviherbaspirillum humi]SNT13945.1 Methyltransferase domain-containing protein [Noviherbaspirillum humi]